MSNSDNNWRGGDDSPQAAKYRWQESSSTSTTGASLPKNRLRWRLCAFACAFLVLFGWVLYIVLQTPAVTPLIVLSATEYNQALPPKAWVEEDVEALKSLDRNSVEFHRIRFDERSDDALGRLRATLRTAARRPGKSLILHVTMHAAVDGNGVPCLIPADADPLNSASWIELEVFLNEANATPELQSKNKLIIIDGVHDLANWDIGAPMNSFVARVAERFKSPAKNTPNTALLLSTGVNQTAWHSPDMQGSVFGQFLKLGLAGVADELVEGGNGDERVSVRELERFLQDHVNRWSIANRGCRQVPLLLNSGGDFQLTSSLNTASRRRMSTNLRVTSHEATTVTTAQLEAVWKSFGQVASDGEFRRLSPREHGQLRRQLLRLEEFATSGKGYAQKASQLLDEIEIRIGRIARATTDSPEWNRSLQHRWNAYQYKPTMFPGASAHDLPAAAYLGRMDVAKAGTLQRSLTAQAGARILQGRSDLRSDASFFQILRRYQVADRWPDAAALGDVINLRHRANVLATPIAPGGESPGDERAHRHIEKLIEDADTHRRAAQDYLLAGQHAGKREVLDALNSARESYDIAEKHLRKISQQYELRDRMLADLPFVAKYILNPTRFEASTSSGFAQDISDRRNHARDLATAVTSLNELANQLDSLDDAKKPSYRALWDAVTKAIDAEATDLLQADPSADVARRLYAILRLPTLPLEQRVALQTRRDEVSAQLNHAFFHPGRSSEIQPVDDSQVIHDASEFVTSWASIGNPVLALVRDAGQPSSGDASKDSSSDLASIETDAEKLRQALSAMSEASAGDDDINRIERRERATCAFWYERSPADPVAQRRFYDLKTWLVWRSERSLLDFLGPVQLGDSPAFAIATRDYLTSANLFSPVQNLASKLEQVTEATNQLQSLLSVNAARTGTDGESLTIKATIATQANVSIGDVGLAGRASLLFGSKSNAGYSDAVPSQVEEAPVVPIPGNGVTVGLQAPLSSDRLFAVLRGHEFKQAFGDGETFGKRVIAELGSDTRTTVTVHKNHTDLSILLLVDGSSSMRDMDDSKTKIAKSKMAINAVLGQLSEITGVRSGVTFYGHRVGYGVDDESERIRIHPAYAGQIPDGLKPERDVESVLPLGRLQQFDAASIRQELTKLTGWGQSPHYQALLSAVESFSSERESSQRAIIMFTDGDDIAEKNDGRRRLEAISWYEVIDAIRGSGISVHIVSPGPSDPADRTSLREIENASNGSFRTSERIASLMAEILANTATDSFTVHGQRKRSGLAITSPQSDTTRTVATIDADSRSKSGEELINSQSINRPVSIENADRYQTLNISVGHVRERLSIAGGENIELLLSPNHNQFEVPAYRRRFARELPLFDADNSAVAVSAYVHRPERSGSRVAFQVSLQHAQHRFTARPTATWIEITPIGPKEYSSFVFYDSTFVEEAPVPVVRCVTPDWPSDADRATVRIWCTPTGVSFNSESITCEALVRGDVTMPNVADVIWRAAPPVRTSQNDVILKLTEQHGPNSTSFGKLMVKFASNLKPQTIEHRYDPERSTISHRFVFRGVEPEAITSGHVRVTKKATIERTSWRSKLTEHFTVDVPRDEEVIIAK